MGITYVKLLYYHGVVEGNVENKILTLEYNNRAVYDCFNNFFTADFGSPDLHLHPITIDDRTSSHKRSRYTPYLLPYAISVASENSVSILTTPSDYTEMIPSSDTHNIHVIRKYVPLQS